MSIATFIEKDGDLYLQQYDFKHKVVRAFESMTGWYWFLVERTEDIYQCPNGTEYGYYYPEGEGKKRKNKPRPPRHKDDKLVDTKWFAYVQGFVNEWGYVCESELRSTPLVWELPKDAIVYSGRRSEQ